MRREPLPAPVCPSGVTGPAGPSERGLEVGVQDGLSIGRLDVVGSLLQLQQHGHLRGRKRDSEG